MKKFILPAILIGTIFISCKEEKKVEVKDNPFTITVNAVVEKDDEFQIYFNEDGSEAYKPEQYINVVVKGKIEPQDLVFTMPPDVSPINLRFDLGSNKELKKVKFNSFKIEFKDKKFEAPSGKFFKYFYPNDQVQCDTISSTGKLLEKANQTYDPIIGATPVLKTEIEKLYSIKQ